MSKKKKRIKSNASNKRRIFGIMGALDVEIEEYLKYLDNHRKKNWKEFIFHEGVFCKKNVVIVKSGVGKVFSAIVTQRMIDVYNPQAIIFTGVAGALNKNLRIGDVVVSKDCIQHDVNAEELGFSRGTIPYTKYKIFKADKTLKSLALSTRLPDKIYEGRILTGDQFLTKKELPQYKYLIEELKGDAIEMEGASVAQVCTINKIPFLIIRTISDSADGKAAEGFNKFLTVITKNSFTILSHILSST